jgi:hypothetical protein
MAAFKKTTQFRNSLTPPELAFICEAHNGGSARIVQEVGFKGIWASGFSVASQFGVRDNNEASWTQVLDVAEFMADASSIPIVLDGDTGYGHFNNFQRLIDVFRSHGISMVIWANQILHSSITAMRDAARDIFEAESLTKIEQRVVSVSEVFRLQGSDWRPLAVASSANKCLHGIPGIASVLANRDVLEREPSQVTSLYLDLAGYYQMQKNGVSLFTQAVQVAQALCKALREFADEGGWATWQKQYRERTDRIRRTLFERAVSSILPAELSASMLTIYRLATKFNCDRLHDAMKVKGFVIYAGQEVT